MDTPRASLIELLRAHQGANVKERSDLEAMRRFAASLSEPFSRRQQRAHFTGSAVLVDERGASVCLVHHGRLHRWFQPGGHADPADGGRMEETALREAREETGCRVSLHPAAPLPLDVDMHPIPAHGDEPAHAHLDVRFLVVAHDPEKLAHDPGESHAARFMPWEEALRHVDDPALVRLLRKARAIAGR
jgi:8-oxo-dGTP pyrophosphatase MutT (NUDIX family)